MRRILAIVAALSLGATVLQAQEPTMRPEIRPFVGAYFPTGAQRELYKDAAMFGVQAALELNPTLHVLGSFGFVPGQNKFAVAQDNVNIFTYDVGIEMGLVRQFASDWQFKPFIGLGGGARTYVHKSDLLTDRTCTAAYGSIGSEIQLGRAALRLEGRDNVFCYRSPTVGVKTKTQNDVGLALGLAYHFR